MTATDGPIMSTVAGFNMSNLTGASNIGVNFYHFAEEVTGLYIYPILCFFGIFGNVVSICVMFNTKKQMSTNIYIAALSVSDIIKILCDFLYFVSVLLMRLKSNVGTNFFATLYPYAHYVFQASMGISTWLTIAIAIDRFICICRSKSSFKKRHCTPRKAKRVSVCIFIIFALLALPYCLRYEIKRKDSNSTRGYINDVGLSYLWLDERFTNGFLWFQFVTKAAIPLIILLLTVPCIIYRIRRYRRATVRFRVTVMLCTVIMIFIVCMFPDAVLSAILCIGYREESYIARGVREITDSLILLNASVNVVVYCSLNSDFRAKLITMIFKRRTTSLEQDEPIHLETDIFLHENVRLNTNRHDDKDLNNTTKH